MSLRQLAAFHPKRQSQTQSTSQASPSSPVASTGSSQPTPGEQAALYSLTSISSPLSGLFPSLYLQRSLAYQDVVRSPASSLSTFHLLLPSRYWSRNRLSRLIDPSWLVLHSRPIHLPCIVIVLVLILPFLPRYHLV